jgi:hypothetical protein
MYKNLFCFQYCVLEYDMIPQYASIHRSLIPIGRSMYRIPYEFCILHSDEFFASIDLLASSVPIMLTVDQKITFSLEFELTKEIEMGSKIAFQIKKLDVKDVIIPCLDVFISLNTILMLFRL